MEMYPFGVGAVRHNNIKPIFWSLFSCNQIEKKKNIYFLGKNNPCYFGREKKTIDQFLLSQSPGVGLAPLPEKQVEFFVDRPERPAVQRA